MQWVVKKKLQHIKDLAGDYILALKGNHGGTHKEVKKFFELHKALGFKGRGYDFLQHKTIDKGHGRIEERKITIMPEVNWMKDYRSWKGLSAVIMIESKRIIKNKETSNTRYYLTSLKHDAEHMLSLIRNHWSIENNMHGVLDVSFKEDSSRVRTRNADKNLATLRRLALNLVKLKKDKKISIKATRKLSGWDDKSLKRILMF